MTNRLNLSSFVVLTFFSPLFIGLSQAEDEDDSPGQQLLSIKSETERASAKCQLENGDEQDDKKRRTIGIGEIVTLTLEGKRAKHVTSATWSLKEGGEQWAILKQDTEDSKKATLTAIKNVTTDGNLTIEVKTNIDEEIEGTPRTIKFKTKVPSAIKGRHSGQRDGDFPGDGDTDNAGASSLIVLIFDPLEVNFEDIEIMERSKDEPGDLPEWMPQHIPSVTALTIKKKK